LPEAVFIGLPGRPEAWDAGGRYFFGCGPEARPDGDVHDFKRLDVYSTRDLNEFSRAEPRANATHVKHASLQTDRSNNVKQTTGTLPTMSFAGFCTSMTDNRMVLQIYHTPANNIIYVMCFVQKRAVNNSKPVLRTVAPIEISMKIA
jgi:hypothetical protein